MVLDCTYWSDGVGVGRMFLMLHRLSLVGSVWREATLRIAGLDRTLRRLVWLFLLDWSRLVAQVNFIEVLVGSWRRWNHKWLCGLLHWQSCLHENRDWIFSDKAFMTLRKSSFLLRLRLNQIHLLLEILLKIILVWALGEVRLLDCRHFLEVFIWIQLLNILWERHVVKLSIGEFGHKVAQLLLMLGLIVESRNSLILSGHLLITKI